MLLVVTPKVSEIVFELVNCNVAEIRVLAGGAIPPPVPISTRIPARVRGR